MTRGCPQLPTVALIVAAGGALRLAGAVLRRPWHDEYFTAWVASLPWGSVVEALRHDSGPPLPYALAKLLALSSLEPLMAARLVAVAAGTLAILVAARAASATAGPRAGVWTAALLAVHPLAVAWSCEGRAYSFLLLGSALVWEGLASLVSTGRGTGKVAAGGLVALWSHGLGLLVLLLTVLISLLLPVAARRRALAAAALIFLAFLPWVPSMAQQPPASLAWMVRAWQALPPLDRALAPVEFLPPVARFATALDLPSAPPVAVAAAALAALALAAALHGSRALLLLTGALVVASALALAVLAHLSIPAFYPGRGEALYLAPAMGLLGAGVARGKLFFFLAALLVGGGVATTGTALVAWSTTSPRPEEQLAQALTTLLPEGGAVQVEGYWRLGLWYHLRESRSTWELRTFPEAAHTHPGWYEEGATPTDGQAALVQLLTELQRGRSVACLMPPQPAESFLRHAAVAAGLSPAARIPQAELWVRRADSP